MRSHCCLMHTAGRRARGFTLVELMVVVVIAALLLTIAVPSYQAYVRKSRRTEARSALMDLAAREERWFSTNNIYTATAAELGYSGAFPQNVGSGYYNVAIASAPLPLTLANSYVITATATGPQAGDTSCSSFTVDQTGTQKSFDSGGAPTTTTCWK